MKTRRGILALLTAGLLVAGPRPSFAQQAPEGCDVPAADLEPPDIPEGYSGVVRIVTVNGRYNRDLCTAPADIADGAPVPTSVLSTYNWGPDCSGQVRFVFLVERPAEGEDDPRLGPVEGDPEGPVIDAELVERLDAVWDEVGEPVFPEPPAAGGGELTEEEQDILDQNWDDVVVVFEEVDQLFPSTVDMAAGQAAESVDIDMPTPSPDPAAGADELAWPEPEEDQEPDLPFGEPPDCAVGDLTAGVWSLSYFGESGPAVRRFSGALSRSDKEDRDDDLWGEILGQGIGFYPSRDLWISDFTKTVAMERGVELEAKDWKRAIVTVQYTCKRKTWVVQYEVIAFPGSTGFLGMFA